MFKHKFISNMFKVAVILDGYLQMIKIGKYQLDSNKINKAQNSIIVFKIDLTSI